MGLSSLNLRRPQMDLVLCHTIADFDTLGAAVGVACLYPQAKIVLMGDCRPAVQHFLAVHQDEYPLVERRAVDSQVLQAIAIVNTQSLARLGPGATWVKAVAGRGGTVTVFDRHCAASGDIPATVTCLEAVGAVTTLIVERLQAAEVTLKVAEATVMALGIHGDTGSLTLASATPRDAAALAWLMGQGASQAAIATFVEPTLPASLQALLPQALADLQRERRQGHTLGWLLLETPEYLPGLSGLAEQLMATTEVDSLIVAVAYASKAGQKVVLIGRARSRGAAQGDRPRVDLNAVFTPLGGGGHAAAAVATVSAADPAQLLQQVLAAIREQLPSVATARVLMSSPVRTIRPVTQIKDAHRILLRYGHSGLSVVDDQGQLVGVISRRDIDLALHHGLGHAPVNGHMTTQIITIAPTTPLAEMQALMVAHDIGRLPVVESGQLLGIVTRTDVLRQLQWIEQADCRESGELVFAPEGRGDVADATVSIQRPPSAHSLRQLLQQRLRPDLWQMLQDMATVAEAQGWHLYLVGGAVRDLLLTPATAPLELQDVDLVVDSTGQTTKMGAGVVLAKAVRATHPEAELKVYGRFQTAALVWPADAQQKCPPLMIDIATARTEFYPYPAANPEVEASSIQQDLYRRDFTINALTICLTSPQAGSLLDFFGGLRDLRQGQIRVLHANSFIEDPTRIYRAVRFSVRLGFTLEPQTEAFIRYALESGIFRRLQAKVASLPALQTRLKAELKYLLEADYWSPALALLNHLGALVCLHPDLTLSDRLNQQLHRLSRWLQKVPQLAALTPWLLRLELLLTALPTSARKSVAETLKLPQSSLSRLATLQTVEQSLLLALPQAECPSEVVQLLQPYDTETLLLLAVCHPRELGDRLWRYLTTWSKVKVPLNGNDLKRLGYRPGPHYREMLDALQAAMLDGSVSDREAAIAFIQQQYARSAPSG